MSSLDAAACAVVAVALLVAITCVARRREAFVIRRDWGSALVPPLTPERPMLGTAVAAGPDLSRDLGQHAGSALPGFAVSEFRPANQWYGASPRA